MESKFSKLSANKTIHFMESGTGPLVLGISGFGCDHYNFEELHKDLSKNFTLITPDNRGMGQSFKAKESYNLEEVAKDALELMDSLGHKEFHLIGISMGGFVSQLLTLLAPQRVKSLTLLCTTSGGKPFLPLPKMSEEALRKFDTLTEPQKSELAIEQIVHPSLKELNPGRFDQIVRLRRNHPAQIEQSIYQKYAVDKFLAEACPIHEIKCPTFILTGEEDRFVPPYNATILAKNIKGAIIKVIEQTDHLFFLEKPRLVGSLINDFLKSLEMRKENRI